ncbi:hypothetical protein Enr13x_02190 [Stieleria neptunia]|uniref:Uncharacterized protein n=1 Tax=Stieleria neptunia TaxID=2527979 RepID=A0A518HHU3_9BACT|nr:hypothetical protein [Stieleria neptunia]QDV40413.1 hypothetical protein Enr13x_02190 [Stieleria neptunia]
MVDNRDALTLEGLLEFEVQGRCFTITAKPELIVVDFPDVQSLLTATRNTGPGISLRSQVNRVGEWLVRTENELDLRIDGETVGSLGFGVPSGLCSLVGVGHFRIAFLSLVRSMF